MRVYLLWLVVFFFCFFSYRDWFKSLCFLIFMMAIVERPDMPRGVAGIPGLNPWNLLLVNVVIAFFVESAKEKKLRPKLPPGIRFCVPFYLFFLLLGFTREITDLKGAVEFYRILGAKPPSTKDFILDGIFNPVKYAVPGLLVYYGCNTPERLRLLIYTMLSLNVLIALQIIQIMPLGSITDGYAMQKRAIIKIDNRLGYYRSDAAIFLAGAAWGIFALQSLFKSRMLKWACLATVGVVALSIALTGGRSGQGVFLLIGGIVAWFKWRRLFILAPLGLLLLVTAVPEVLDRFTQGMEYDPDDPHFKNAESVEAGQMKSMTSGRTSIWPHVIDGIGDAPFIGHGKNAMQRTGIASRLYTEHGELFPHPHNAYLQLFLDNGFLLAIPILYLYFSACLRAFRLFRDQDDILCQVAGAMCFSMLLSFLVGAVAQQSFYPPASSVVLLCAMGLAVRLHAERYIFGNVRNFETEKSRTWNTKLQGDVATVEKKRARAF